MGLFSKKQKNVLDNSGYCRTIKLFEEENKKKMKITLGNGLTLDGTQEDVIKAMHLLGYGNKQEEFYYSESKGLFIRISEMETSHLRNAVLKLNREWAESLSQLSEPEAVADAILCGNQDRTFQVMLDELADRDEEF